MNPTQPSTRLARAAVAALALTAGALPAHAFGPQYTINWGVGWTHEEGPGCSLEGTGTSYTPSFFRDCSAAVTRADSVIGPGVAQGEIYSAMWRASPYYGHYAFSNFDHVWSDALTIVSATLPAGTLVTLDLAAQVALSYDIVLSINGYDPYVSADVFINAGTAGQAGMARSSFVSWPGEGWTLGEPSGAWSEASSALTWGNNNAAISVQVGDVVPIELHFRASGGGGSPGWADERISMTTDLKVNANYAISVHAADGSAVDYVAASGARFPNVLPPPVPEPASGALLALGLAIVGLLRCRAIARPRPSQAGQGST